MSLFGKWFSKSPSDLLLKGDNYLKMGDCFDARVCFEDGLRLCTGTGADHELESIFAQRIDAANRMLAERNIEEAENAYSRGDVKKSLEHLELVKTLTYDQAIREKADKLLLDYSSDDESHDDVAPASHCASCSGAGHDGGESTIYNDSLPLLEYYELLLQQLPLDQQERYSVLGEKFAYAFVAASRDEQYEALAALEVCRDFLPTDIYLCEKGKIQHRLGNNVEAEQSLREAVRQSTANSLAWLSLALVLVENSHFADALVTVDSMISEQILPDQAKLLRADIFQACGDAESAVNQYVELLHTPYVRAAAEKLYLLLLESGRHDDAKVISAKYLRKSCH